MSIAIQNIPFLCLMWIGIGFIFIIVSIFMLASHSESSSHYVEFSNEKLSGQYNKEVEELFSFFLEEEEKKNQGLRELLMDSVNKKNSSKEESSLSHKVKANADSSQGNNQSSDEVNEIIKLYKEGLSSEEIAKKLKKGVGEVNLMISLYSMR